jgi:hypothetical protein
MTISDLQLETWSHQGAITTSKDTYATVKRALEDPRAAYAQRQFKVFLQGSYGNDTNIYAESDVDIVICYVDAFFYDLDYLTADQQYVLKVSLGTASYSYNTFKAEVLAALALPFGSSVLPYSNWPTTDNCCQLTSPSRCETSTPTTVFLPFRSSSKAASVVTDIGWTN